MKRQFVKAASAAKMLDAFENKLSEMKGSDVESATDIPKPRSSVALTPEQEDLLWEIDGRYDNVDVADEAIPTVIAEIRKAIVNEIGLSDRDARRVMIDILGYNPDDLPIELESGTQVTCGEYIDVDGMFGEPGAIVTDDEMHAYWDAEHKDDPVLAEYPDFESWWSDTKHWMKPTDNSYADMYIDNQLDSAWGDDTESTMYRSLDSSVDEVDEYDEPVLGEEDEMDSIECGLFDDYFGKDKAEKFGDLIAENLAGQTVSKRRDLAEQPGGLIYEANLLGIDMWDLLEALEGMCYQGRAMEIDDSTYKIK